MGRASSAMVLVAGCWAAACGRETAKTVAEASEPRVLASGVTIEQDDPEGVRLVLRAEEASFSDLPGHGQGSFRGVELRRSEAGGRELWVWAEEAELSADGVVTLREARARDRVDGSLRLRAKRLRLGGEASIVAQGVRARYRVEP